MTKTPETVKTLLKQYTFLDGLDLIKTEKKLNFKPNSILKCKDVNENTVKTLLEQQLNKSQFEFLENEMFESIYKSTKNASLGKGQQSQSIPENVTNFSKTFGIKTKTGCKLYDVILPPISPRRVLLNSQEGHKLYVKTHEHYNPSERITRPYCSEVVNLNHTFGKYYKVNTTGQGAKKALNFHYFHNRVISKIQAETKYEKDDNRKCTKPSEMFGKMNLNQEIAYLNTLRNNLKKKKMCFKNLIKFVKNDCLTNLHLISRNELIDSLSRQNIFIDLSKMKQILDKFEITDGSSNQIKYIEFIKLLDVKNPFPKLNLKVEKTDLSNEETVNCQVIERNQPVRTDRYTVQMLTAPKDYFLQLNDIDYDIPRSKDEIMEIFTRSGWISNVATFKKLWNNCQAINGKISIKSFKQNINFSF